jgi:thioredoxin-dependent peroxiredoxin
VLRPCGFFMNIFANPIQSHVSMRWASGSIVAIILAAVAFGATGSSIPKVGEIAPNFTLHTLDDRPVELNRLVEDSHVILVVLRGWPGYQCPLCTRQVQDFITQADSFASVKATVLMIYPGPAPKLKEHASEFLQNKTWPAAFIFVADPDFAFANAYGLRWDAAKETVYPSTFVIERGGRIRFAQVSQSHGNRLSAVHAIAALKNSIP